MDPETPRPNPVMAIMLGVCKAAEANAAELRDDEEQKRRAQFLHDNKAPHNWVILTIDEVAALKSEVDKMNVVYAALDKEKQEQLAEAKRNLAATVQNSVAERDRLNRQLSSSQYKRNIWEAWARDFLEQRGIEFEDHPNGQRAAIGQLIAKLCGQVEAAREKAEYFERKLNQCPSSPAA